MEVYDMMGRFVKKIIIAKGQQEVVLNISSWENGIYFLKLMSDGLEISTGKLLVQ